MVDYIKMTSSNSLLHNAIAQCHYDQRRKNTISQEVTSLLLTTPTLTPQSTKIMVNNTLYYILELIGTIPVPYAGVIYQIPIKIEIPVDYPNYPPLLIVTPRSDMIIKASEYVREDGTFMLKILREKNPRYTLQYLIEEAKKCFSWKMPVFKRTKNPPPSNPPSNPPQAYQSMDYHPSGYPLPKYSQATSYPPGSYGQSPNNYPNPSSNPPTQNHLDSDFSSLPMGSYVNPQESVEKINQNLDLMNIRAIYEQTLKELTEEIKLLTNESEGISKKSIEIEETVRNFREEIEKGVGTKEVLRASIENTREWIDACNNGNFSDLAEGELVEYRNNAAKESMILHSEEKSIEATIQAITDSMNKSVTPAKDAIIHIKQLATSLFMTSRLKEKAERIAKVQY